MPYIEILAPRAEAPNKRELADALTRAVVDAFTVALPTVTIYFVPIGPCDYAHEGVLGHMPDGARVFVKVHAYRRTLAERRRLARAMTPLLAACFGTSSGNVAVYFLDRERDEVAHDGHMVSDASHSSPDFVIAP